MENNLWTIIVVVVVVAWSIWSAVSSGKRKKAVAVALEGDVRIIDVRTSGEFAGGHYPGAVNIPVDSLSKNIRKVGSKDQTILVYCASGARSASAAATLKSQGFTRVINGGALSDLPRKQG